MYTNFDSPGCHIVSVCVCAYCVCCTAVPFEEMENSIIHQQYRHLNPIPIVFVACLLNFGYIDGGSENGGVFISVGGGDGGGGGSNVVKAIQ